METGFACANKVKKCNTKKIKWVEYLSLSFQPFCFWHSLWQRLVLQCPSWNIHNPHGIVAIRPRTRKEPTVPASVGIPVTWLIKFLYSTFSKTGNALFTVRMSTRENPWFYVKVTTYITFQCIHNIHRAFCRLLNGGLRRRRTTSMIGKQIWGPKNHCRCLARNCSLINNGDIPTVSIPKKKINKYTFPSTFFVYI